MHLTPAEIAKELDVTPAAVRQWIRHGWLKAHRVGGRWRVKRTDYERFKKGGMKTGPAPLHGPE